MKLPARSHIGPLHIFWQKYTDDRTRLPGRLDLHITRQQVYALTDINQPDAFTALRFAYALAIVFHQDTDFRRMFVQ